MSADPEKYIAVWARQGAPLGMSAEIPVSGVFPNGLVSGTGDGGSPGFGMAVGIQELFLCRSRP